MRKIPLAVLKSVEANRPVGYADALFSNGRLEGDILLIEDATYFEILGKHFPSLELKFKTVPKSVPQDEWPIWTKAFKLMANPEDKGIGDVVARMIGDTNSAAFKAWYLATFGKTCGCAGRQAKWNQMYPLGNETAS